MAPGADLDPPGGETPSAGRRVFRRVTNALAGWPSFSETAIRAVEAVLRSGRVNYWTGSRGREFEQRYG